LTLSHLPALPFPALYLFFFYSSVHLRDLHSFPTRRSSDLSSTACFRYNLACPLKSGWRLIGRCSTRSRPAFTSSLYISATTTKRDRKSTRLNSSHVAISYAVFCLKKKKKQK